MVFKTTNIFLLFYIILDCVRLRDSSFGLVGAGRKNLQKCTSQCLQKGQSQAGYKFAQSVSTEYIEFKLDSL